VQQILVGLRMSMAPSRHDPADQLPRRLVEGWMQLVQMAIDHLHELTVVLRKPELDNQGLLAAIRSYVDKLTLGPNQKVLLKTDAKVGTLAPNAAVACFRIVQEGLSNAVQHSEAKNLVVQMKSAANRLTVSIRDDGVGFDVDDARAHAEDVDSIGLSSMRERAALAGGRFDIRSVIGRGTLIRASFPLEKDHAAATIHAKISRVWRPMTSESPFTNDPV
jgi:two-component system sensor histidine kinase UhpB